MNEADVPPSRPRAQKRGCVLRGCLVLFIVVMLMGVILGFVGRYVYYGLAPFLSQEPAPIRIYPATDEQYQAVLAKVAPFNRAVDAGTKATLELTAEDLDILIARDPAWADVRGQLYLAIAHDDLVADVSARADKEDNPQVKLFFNGRFTLGASIADGEFTAVLRRLETLSGQPLASLLARGIGSPGIAQSFDAGVNRRIKENSYLARYMTRLRTVRIEHGHILAISAGDPAPAAATPTPVAPPAAPE